MTKYYKVVNEIQEVVARGKVFDFDFDDEDLTHADVADARLEALVLDGYLEDAGYDILEIDERTYKALGSNKSLLML